MKEFLKSVLMYNIYVHIYAYGQQIYINHMHTYTYIFLKDKFNDMLTYKLMICMKKKKKK